MQLNSQDIIIKLFGDIQVRPLENIIFNAIVFLSAITAFILTIKEFLFDFSNNSLYADAAASVIFTLLYLTGKKSLNITMLVWTLLVTATALVSVEWFLVAGVDGIAWIIFIAVCAVTQTMFSGKHLFAANIWNGFILITIYASSKIYRENIPGILNTNINIDYFFIDIAMLASGLAFIIYIVMREYRHKHQKILNLNDELVKASLHLEDKNLELSKALDEIRDLREIIPICASCKNIRNDKGFYESVEEYMQRHSEVNFSHTICPDCLKKDHPELYEKIFSDKEPNHK